MQLYTKILIGMVVGAVLGALLGPNSWMLDHDGATLGSSATVVEDRGGVAPNLFAGGIGDFEVLSEAGDEGQWLELTWKIDTGDILRFQSAGIDGAEDLSPGDEFRGWVEADPLSVRRYSRLGAWLVGATSWIGELFLAMIKMVVVPLVFLSLLVGVASLGDFRKLGRIGGRTIGYFMMTTVMALILGVGMANIVRPGAVLSEEDREMMLASYEDAATNTASNAAEAPSLGEQIVGIVPTNPFQSLVEGDMLQIIFIALLFGVALTLLEPERSKPVVDLADRANDAVVMVVLLAMKLAPYGVAALLFRVVGTTGITVLLALGVYGLVVVVALLLHVLITYGLVIKYGAKLKLVPFLKSIRPALLLAFSTSSSSATLPVTKQCAEDNLNVSQPVTSFVLPLGATINMDGTALYQGVAALFIAQIYHMDLTMADQATIVLTATLASIGAAGVPGAGMVTLAMVLASIGVPTEGVALILGVDRLLDMFRTTTNVVGDATAAAFMGRLEGDELHIRTPAEDAADPDHGLEGRTLTAHKVDVDHED